MERKIISTLPITKIYPFRRSGNGVRLIDSAIQIIFEGHICLVQDEFEKGTNNKANKYLFKRVLKRLASEHNLDYLIKNNKIKIDNKELTINLITQ